MAAVIILGDRSKLLAAVVMFTGASSKGLRDCSKAEGFSPHRTKTQGGFPPYLRAAQCGGVGVVVGVGARAGSWLPGSSREATDPS